MNQQENKESSGHIKASIITGIFAILAACVGGFFLVFNTMIENGFVVFGMSNPNPSQISTPNQFSTSNNSPTEETVQQIFPVSIYINAKNNEWTDTGINITSGNYLSITASGKITTWIGNSAGDSFPDGNAWDCNESSCILYGEKFGVLLGMIENGQPFLVGSSFSSPMGTSGRLFLRINDKSDSFLDNDGEYQVTIDVK